MSEFIFCIVFCSISSIFLYLLGMIVLNFNSRGKRFQEIYCFLHAYVVFLPVLLLLSVSIMLSEKLLPGTFLLSIQTRHAEQIIQKAFIVWSIGAVVQGLWFAKQYWHFYKIRRISHAANDEIQRKAIAFAKRLDIKRTPEIYVGEWMDSAEMVSGRKPIIYLPDQEFSVSQIESLLLHELVHYKMGDIWFRRVSMVLHTIFWFNPVLRILLRSLDRWDELHCDYLACSFELVTKEEYGETVLLVAERLSKMKQEPFLRPGMRPNKKKPLAERMRNIMGWKEVRRMNKRIIAVMVLIMVLLGSGISVTAAVVLNEINEWDLNNSGLGIPEEVIEEELIEYEMMGSIMEDELISSSGVEIQASPSGFISTSLKNQTWKSGIFSASSGQTITVSISSCVPTSVTINAGIIEPDGMWRWVNGEGSFSHDFSLDQTGYYQVFVRNKTTNSVTIVGAYSTYSDK